METIGPVSAGRDIGDATQEFGDGFLCIAGPGREEDVKAKRAGRRAGWAGWGGFPHPWSVPLPQGAGDVPLGKGLWFSGWKRRAMDPAGWRMETVAT